MTTIERRLEALEAATPDIEPTVSLVYCVAPGPDREVNAADVHGLKLRRQDDESEDAFKARARAVGLANIEPPRTGAIVVLYTEPAGVNP